MFMHGHAWSVHMQIHLLCCVYAGSFMEFQCFEVKPEDDSKEITGCPHDVKPSTGMLASSVPLLILIMLSVFWLLPQPRLSVVMFSLCLSVCLSVCRISQKVVDQF